jgi:hypothetical protein
MKQMKDLIDRQNQLIEETEVAKVSLQKKEIELSGISEKIKDLKKQQDYGAFKFVHSNFPAIVNKIAPKHKLPPDHEVKLTSSGTDITAKIPWAHEECSDTNPVNVNVCPRCTMIHFQVLMDRMLAEYYTS